MPIAVPHLFGRVPSPTTQFGAFFGSLLLVFVIGWADEATGEHVLLDAFYLVPVLVATWFLGLRGGLLVAVLSTIVWVMVREFGVGFSDLSIGVALWNGVMRLSVDATVAFLLSRARREGYALRTALEAKRKLPDVIPICAWCRKLRDESEQWQTLETFLAKESDVLLTHGVCADCAARLREETRAELAGRSPASATTGSGPARSIPTR